MGTMTRVMYRLPGDACTATVEPRLVLGLGMRYRIRLWGNGVARYAITRLYKSAAAARRAAQRYLDRHNLRSAWASWYRCWLYYTPGWYAACF